MNSPDLINQVSAIILTFVSNFNQQTDFSIRNSKNNNYLSISANIVATSQQQLDSIYLALNNHDLIKVTL
jgi:putative lipoic acid-binding regulatory protein